MKTYMIERDIPGVDQLTAEQLKGAAATSNAALAQLAPRIQWVESFVTQDKTFCIYRAEDELHMTALLVALPPDQIGAISGIPAAMEARVSPGATL